MTERYSPDRAGTVAEIDKAILCVLASADTTDRIKESGRDSPAESRCIFIH